MKHCNHSEWLTLRIEKNEIILLESDRLQTLVDDFQNQDVEKASLIVLIGGDTKSAAVNSLTSQSISRKKRHRTGDIHLYRGNQFSLDNVFLADGEFPYRTSRKRSSQDCHETRRHILPRLRGGISRKVLDETAAKVYYQLLSPFTDVLCLFSDDIGGFQSVVHYLSICIEARLSQETPEKTEPQVLVVVGAEDLSSENEGNLKQVLLSSLESVTTESLETTFSDLKVVTVPLEINKSGNDSNARLKERLALAIDQVRTDRIEKRLLFSVRHFVAFFNNACGHHSRSSTEPFNFVKSSRLRNPVSPDLFRHLTNLLKTVESPREVIDFAVPVIASSFLLNHYVPGMHLFEPGVVFQTLYKDVCLEVARRGSLNHDEDTEIFLPSGFVKMLESEMKRGFEKHLEGVPSAVIHLNNLQRFRRTWQRTRSDETCFSCLHRDFITVLPCGHAICQICPRIFGSVSDNDRWVFQIHNCFLCLLKLQDVTVRVRPDTAGVNVLSIGGGGIRGVVPLIFLEVLQERIGLPRRVYRNFLFSFGSSSGSHNVLAMQILDMSIEECLKLYYNLAQTVFKRRWFARLPIQIPVLSYFLEILMSYLADGLYPAENLEAALQEIFGSNRSLMDYSHATASGAKLGIPVTSVWDISSCVFTNYNENGVRPQDCGYRIIRSNSASRRVLLWEVARCSSAAPWYFSPKHIPGIGVFQDGALWQPNPDEIALWEFPHAWPQFTKPNLIVSLGTGSFRPQSQRRDKWPMSVWRNGFIPRLYRAFMGFVDGKKMAQAFRNGRVDLEGRYFHFDVELDKELDLDAVSKIPELADEARVQFRQSKDVDVVARAIAASNFYFEMESKPKKVKGKYSGVGHIFCTFVRNTPDLDALIDQLSRRSAKFIVNDEVVSGKLENRSFYDDDGNFRKRVAFSVRDKISIFLKEGTAKPRHISNSPFLISDLNELQGFNDDFGRSDHRKRKRFENNDGVSKKRRKLS